MKLFTAPRALLIFLLTGGALVAGGACGYPTFGFDPIGSGTTGSVITGTGGGGGTGAVTSSNGTGGAAACTISHTGKQGTCEYLPGKECGCTMPKEKCAVETLATGESNCIPIGSTAKPKWSGCATDADCAKGTWCDHRDRVCKPICSTGDDCDPGEQCIEVAQDAVATPIPGLRVCTAHCNPIFPDPPCGTGLTCVYNFDVNVKDSECATTEGIPEGSECTAANSCDPGLICVGNAPSYTCQQWCTPADGIDHPACPNSRPLCKAFIPTVIFDGVSYGVCSP
jgi:hypothetical protein